MFIEAQLGCHLHGVYINTVANHLADDLFRDRMFSFFSKVPPSPISNLLLDLLLNPQVDWVSPQWR